jgi:hypothetical protein
MGVFAAQTFGDNYNDINRLARKIHNKSKVLLKETKHYRSSPNYVSMVGHVNELDQSACRLRDIADSFQKVAYLFKTTELCPIQYGRGFIKGHTAHVSRLLESIDRAIVEIGGDINYLRATAPQPRESASVDFLGDPTAQRPIITRVETYQIPDRSIFGTPNRIAKPRVTYFIK